MQVLTPLNWAICVKIQLILKITCIDQKYMFMLVFPQIPNFLRGSPRAHI